MSEEYNRLKEWVDKSHKLPQAGENPWMVMDFQHLGRLDIKIEQLWAELRPRNGAPRDIKEAFESQEAYYLSRLWVLAGYEIVRILKEADNRRFGEVYKLFKSVRIPLAKYEKPNKHGKLHIAHLGIATNNGSIGWEVEAGKFVTRDELASKLLESI